MKEQALVNRPVLIAVAGIAVLLAAVGLTLWPRGHEEAPALQPASTAAPAVKPAPAAAPAVAASPVPSFDVVRIDPQGQTVIAGRSLPKAEISILDGGKEIGHVTADSRGEWVFVPDHPLPPGSRELSLRAKNPDGSSADSAAPVVLVVPPRTNGQGASLALKVNPDGSISILQGPQAKEGAGTISIGAIRLDGQGRLAVAGQAKPLAHVQLYLDDAALGAARADDKGAWSLTATTDLKLGGHRLRADEIGPDGKVAARAEVSFAPEEAAEAATQKPGSITVEKGNCLWRIARRTYGRGSDFMLIFQANKGQIRDPNRIYPGQVFALPHP
ncbi:LysM domain/BON superfamily protein [mine drainage metagenome]|uniref:LysM domain/BON superfamily protein n=1 Tax=mine drainage metagenome TaxID=410659 RepID=A0A1J5SCQ1_9ZZZZ